MTRKVQLRPERRVLHKTETDRSRASEAGDGGPRIGERLMQDGRAQMVKGSLAERMNKAEERSRPRVPSQDSCLASRCRGGERLKQADKDREVTDVRAVTSEIFQKRRVPLKH